MDYKQKILIVDDKPENLFACEKILGEVDAEIIKATDGNSALIATLHHDFALAILDVQMPNMDGYELAELIRNDEKIRHLPIIFLSAVYTDDIHIFKGYESGAVDFITKPFNPRLLLSKVKIFLELDRQKKELVKQKSHLEKLFHEVRKTNELLENEITERKRAEEALKKAHTTLKMSQAQLIQSEKMCALGTMVAGIAHELNNPLMGLINYIEYCMKNTCKDDEKHTILEKAERATNRCITIVKDLLTFSHMEIEGKEGFQKGDYTTILDQVIELLSYRFKKEQVQVIKRYAEDIPEIWMRINCLQQVFINIITNALDALQKSKKKKEINIDIYRNGENVQTTVTDNGCGIDEKNLQKIYDPFFTTKPPGKGTGLGLTICQSIVRMHGGRITCKSKQGQGSTFEILLPIKRWEDG